MPNTAPDPDRRRWLAAALLAPGLGLLGCGGGGDGGAPNPPTPPAPPPGGGGVTPGGRLVLKLRQPEALAVVDLAARRVASVPTVSSGLVIGVGASRNGFLSEVVGDDGSGRWQIELRTLDLAKVATYTVGGLLAFPTSVAALNADATRMAFSVNEQASANDSTRLDRCYVYDLRTGAQLAAIDDRQEPAFVDTGELLLRRGDRLHVFDTQLRDQGALPISVGLAAGVYSASPDGRHVAYENGSRISVYDRSTGAGWDATPLAPLGAAAPVFSPDGQWLALLHTGGVAGRYLQVIAFRPGVTTTLDASGDWRDAGGDTLWSGAPMGWAR